MSSTMAILVIQSSNQSSLRSTRLSGIRGPFPGKMTWRARRSYLKFIERGHIRKWPDRVRDYTNELRCFAEERAGIPEGQDRNVGPNIDLAEPVCNGGWGWTRSLRRDHARTNREVSRINTTATTVRNLLGHSFPAIIRATWMPLGVLLLPY